MVSPEDPIGAYYSEATTAAPKMSGIGPSAKWRARLVEVRSLGHSGSDLLTLSSSHFDPNRTLGRGWASQLDWIKAVIYRR